MTQKMPSYLDKMYPQQAFISETKNAAHEVKKRRDAQFWNETEEKFHDWYVDMEKCETVERSECVALFVGEFANGAGSIHNCYRPRTLVG